MKFNYEYSELIYHTKIFLNKEGNTFYVKKSHNDGTENMNEMVDTEIGETIQLEYKNKSHGDEYYILHKDGTIDFYNDENKKFKTLKPIG